MSMKKAEQLLEQYTVRDLVDIVVLSEMAFTGYKFEDKKDIESFLEKAGDGPTFLWCSKLAQRLNCWVFCGYPEIDGDNLYNSQQVISPNGEYVKNYRKHFLYKIDKTWASEGPAFDTFEFKLPRSDAIIKIGHGICMDIEPWEFKAP